MVVDGLLVEGVDGGRVGPAAASADGISDVIERSEGAPSEMDPCSLSGEARATAPPIAPPPP